MRRLKVALVAASPFPCPRGTPVRALRMAEALSRRGHEIHVFTYIWRWAKSENRSKCTGLRTSGRVSFLSGAPGVVYLDTGWLAPDDDVAAFADGIITLLGDFRRAAELGRRAREYVKQEHSWERCASQVEEVYRVLMVAESEPSLGGHSVI